MTPPKPTLPPPPCNLTFPKHLIFLLSNAQRYRNHQHTTLSLCMFFSSSKGAEEAYRCTAKLFAQQHQHRHHHQQKRSLKEAPTTAAPAHGQAVGVSESEETESGVGGDWATSRSQTEEEGGTTMTDFCDFDIASPQVCSETCRGISYCLCECKGSIFSRSVMVCQLALRHVGLGRVCFRVGGVGGLVVLVFLVCLFLQKEASSFSITTRFTSPAFRTPAASVGATMRSTFCLCPRNVLRWAIVSGRRSVRNTRFYFSRWRSCEIQAGWLGDLSSCVSLCLSS